jgi:hypothetical protein
MGNGETAAAGTNPNGEDSTCDWYPTNPSMGNFQVELDYYTGQPAGTAKDVPFDPCSAEPQQISGESYEGYYVACTGYISVSGQIGGTVVGLGWDNEGAETYTPPTESQLESDVSTVFGEVGQ